MSTVIAERRGPVRTLGVLSVILGLIFIVAGAVTWGLVSSNLAAERITVAELAQTRTTNSWEVVTGMARRLPRVYDAASGPVGLRTLTERS